MGCKTMSFIQIVKKVEVKRRIKGLELEEKSMAVKIRRQESP